MICSYCVTTFGDTESLNSYQKEVHGLPRLITALKYGDKQPTTTANNATTSTTKQRLKDHNCFMYGFATAWHRKLNQHSSHPDNTHDSRELIPENARKLTLLLINHGMKMTCLWVLDKFHDSKKSKSAEPTFFSK